MEQVKTAPADTTSEESCQQSSVTSHMTAHYPYPQQPLYDDNCNEPNSKRLRLEDYACSAVGERQTSSETSLHHFKGRTIPVGIAKPFRKDTQNYTISGASYSTVPEDEVDSLIIDQDKQSFKDDQTSKISYKPLRLSQSLGLEVFDDGSDSDDSKDSNRFNRFTNESDPSHKVDDSFSASFDKESSEEINTEEHIATDSRAIDNSDNTAIDNSHQGILWVQKDMRPNEHNFPNIKNSSSGLVVHSSIKEPNRQLPVGKAWVVFVSHSSPDKDWAKGKLVIPFRDRKKQVAASYHFLPDTKKVLEEMQKSCVIIISLSELYLRSERCTGEWNHALNLSKSLECEVVLAAVSTVPRPQPLKQFLYLDFIKREKQENVWTKLTEHINMFLEHKMKSSENHSDKVTEALHHRYPFIDQTVTEAHHTYHPHTVSEPDHIHHPHTVSEPDHTHHPHTVSEPNHTHHPYTVSEPDYTHHPHTVSEPDHTHHPHTVSEPDHTHHPHTVSEPDHTHHPHTVSEPDHTHHPYSIREYDKFDRPNDFEAMYEECLENEVSNDSKRHIQSDHMITREDHVTGGNSPLLAQDLLHGNDQVNNETPFEQTQQDILSDSGKGDVEEGEVNDSSDETAPGQPEDNQATKVTSFYNQLAKPDADKRTESPIFYMRNFNNWVKSILIRTHLALVSPGASVLDLCCGKGGDLLKWKEGRINYLVGADISDVSVKAAEGRYRSDKMVDKRTRRCAFSAEFIHVDCCQVRLRDRYDSPGRRFHVTSCQFSIHYSFESYEKAHMMLRNACENIVPGGYLIGTTIDSNQLIYRLRKAGQNEEGFWSFGNDIFSVTLDPTFDLNEKLPIFGTKYNFKLHGVVDLPEYLVHFPTFIRMLEEFDMKVIQRQNFYDFFQEHRYKYRDADLLFRMSAFNKRSGTMSLSEWEAIGLYMVFIFQKKNNQQ